MRYFSTSLKVMIKIHSERRKKTEKSQRGPSTPWNSQLLFRLTSFILFDFRHIYCNPYRKKIIQPMLGLKSEVQLLIIEHTSNTPISTVENGRILKFNDLTVHSN
jgi:hypothetical protein